MGRDVHGERCTWGEMYMGRDAGFQRVARRFAGSNGSVTVNKKSTRESLSSPGYRGSPWSGPHSRTPLCMDTLDYRSQFGLDGSTGMSDPGTKK